MPIVVNPGYVWPPETDPVVSPDGRITAIVDPAHAGVLLRADFDDSVPDQPAQPAQPETVFRTNRIPNPNFANTSVDAVSGSLTLEGGKAKITATGGSTYVSQAYSVPENVWVSVRVGVEWISGGAGRARLQIQFYNSAGSSISAEHTVVDKPDLPSGGRIQVTAQAPAGTVQIRVYLWAYKQGAFANLDSGQAMLTDRWHSDYAQTKSTAEASVAEYFDGSTDSENGKQYRWSATANNSASQEYTPAKPEMPATPGHDATTAKVRFERQDGTVVRSGNPAWSPGGYAHAYDHEATLGGGTLWRAVPILFDGSEGTPSEYVGAVIPALSDGWAWLKPVSDPNKAMLLKVEPPDLSYDGRVDTTSIAGSARPAATWDVLEGFTTQLRSLVREKPVADQLMALLDEGPVLAQFPACAGLPDFYFIRGKVDLEHVHWDGYPWRRYQWDVISIDRPETTDSPLRIPALSYDTVERDWTTYDQLKSTVTSYNKLLEP